MANLKQVALSISIAVVLAFFIGFGIETFYPGPDYEKCNVAYDFPKMVNNNCTQGTTTEEQSCYTTRGSPVYNHSSGCPVYESCNYCYRDLEDERKPYDRNVFVIASVIGIIAILLGTLKLTHESVSTGIMAGGVLSVLYGTFRFFPQADNWMRFLAMGLILTILIWIGYKKLNFDNTKRK